MRDLKNNFFVYLIFGCTGSSLLHMGLLYLQQVGVSLHCGAAAFHCGGFSCCGAWALEHGLSSCGTLTYLPLDMWNLPGPGIEPMCATLAGRFPSTGPLGKSEIILDKTWQLGEKRG